MNRDGFALAFVLLVLAAVELLTLSSIALTTHEGVIAHTRVRTAVAGRAAEAGLAQTSNQWPQLHLDSLPIGGIRRLAFSGNTFVAVERTAWGAFLATATALEGKARAHRAAVLRTLDLHRGMEESNEAVVTAGPIVLAAAVLSIETEGPCEIFAPQSRPAQLLTVADRFAALGRPDAVVDSAHARLPDGYALAGIRWTELAGIADLVVRGSLVLPVDTAELATSHLIYSDGDVELSGSGRGLLFVNGDLVIVRAASFVGIIVVRGSVIVGDAAELRGTLRIGGSRPSVIGAARVTYARCACARALATAPAARRLIRGYRFYIPAF